ncbi:hypothetical protein [Pseudorhodoferax sp. Leaf274]|uniref:hypothetical protein n=1 Tax=Pseudorhodoferax sp. Leaf274 TaxID=1736318 RepID=UPI0007033DF0|nr:hypothetical protein [Pseudorhodoferax sp. Leaf274]KQP36110.1 hypothetical protein ASF44_16200 [Pseudorhodoferax sp. Leaf274]
MSKVYFGGMPTEPDVKKLLAAFPDIQEGDEIAHEDIERVIGHKREDNRYRAVVAAWRKRLLNDENQDLGAVSGIGFKCLAPDERISRSVDGFQSGTRKQLRSVRRAQLVRTDDPILTAKQDGMRRYGLALADQAAKMMKEIEPPKPQAQMPRLVPRTGTH